MTTASLTIRAIETAATAIFGAYHVTTRHEDGGSVEVPGLIIYWDGATDDGWAFNSARSMSATGEWTYDETGSVDTLAEVEALLKAAHAVATAANFI